jgi:HTH-type transcriptional regulator / antitoxin HigA
MSNSKHGHPQRQSREGAKEMSTGLIDEKVYCKLLSEARPHVIHTEEENERYIADLEELHSRGRLSPEEEQLAELLTLLIEKFEERYQIEPGATSLDVVRSLMDAHGVKQSDMLDVFGTRSVASEVLSGKRELSKTHIQRLSRRFHVSPAVFFPD